MNPAEAYILNQEEPFRSILLELQAVIEHHLPQAELKYKYRLPFYYLKGKPFCYLNTTKEYVDLGFPDGVRLSRFQNEMVAAKRKRVRSLRYRAQSEIEYELLVGILDEASDVIRIRANR